MLDMYIDGQASLSPEGLAKLLLGIHKGMPFTKACASSDLSTER